MATQKLVSADVLTHYDLNKPLRLKCDASPYGVGACLTHIMEDGSERPVAFASRSLSSTETERPMPRLREKLFH